MGQVTVNEELDPELVIQRLRAEVADLRAEIRHASCLLTRQRSCMCCAQEEAANAVSRMLRGEAEDRGPLTLEESASLHAALDAYLGDPEAEVPPVFMSDTRMIRRVTQQPALCRAAMRCAMR